MASTVNRTGEQQPVVDKGHGTEALGPGDTSDSGSDVVGGPGLNEELKQGIGLGLDRGTTSDPDVSFDDEQTAGPDAGDANLDGDSTASGSGERATVGRDAFSEAGSDIDTDRIEHITEVGGVVGPPDEGSGSTLNIPDESAQEGAAEADGSSATDEAAPARTNRRR